KNGLTSHQTPAANHAIQVANVNTTVGEPVLVKSGTHGGAMSGDESFLFLADAKDVAAQRINRDDAGMHVVFADVFSATAQRAAGAGGDKNVIGRLAEPDYDLVHRLMVSQRIPLV